MKKIKLLLLIVLFTVTSCDVLNDVAGMYNFTKCDFRLASINNITLAGINVQNITTLSGLTILDAAKLTAAVATNYFPLSFNLNVDVKNPNTKKAVMNGMEWILLIDNIEMTRGSLNNRIEVLPKNQSTMPINFTFDLKKVLSGKSADAITNFGLNLAGSGNRPTRVALKAKPSMLIGSVTVPYPDYITIRQDFGK